MIYATFLLRYGMSQADSANVHENVTTIFSMLKVNRIVFGVVIFEVIKATLIRRPTDHKLSILPLFMIAFVIKSLPFGKIPKFHQDLCGKSANVKGFFYSSQLIRSQTLLHSKKGSRLLKTVITERTLLFQENFVYCSFNSWRPI